MGDRETLSETEGKRIKTTQIEAKKARRTGGFLACEQPGATMPAWLAGTNPRMPLRLYRTPAAALLPIKTPAIKGKPEGHRCLLATLLGLRAALPLGPLTKELNLAQCWN